MLLELWELFTKMKDCKDDAVQYERCRQEYKNKWCSEEAADLLDCRDELFNDDSFFDKSPREIDEADDKIREKYKDKKLDAEFKKDSETEEIDTEIKIAEEEYNKAKKKKKNEEAKQWEAWLKLLRYRQKNGREDSEEYRKLCENYTSCWRKDQMNPFRDICEVSPNEIGAEDERAAGYNADMEKKFGEDREYERGKEGSLQWNLEEKIIKFIDGREFDGDQLKDDNFTAVKNDCYDEFLKALSKEERNQIDNKLRTTLKEFILNKLESEKTDDYYDDTSLNRDSLSTKLLSVELLDL